jgi:hypothetical protein
MKSRNKATGVLRRWSAWRGRQTRILLYRLLKRADALKRTFCVSMQIKTRKSAVIDFYRYEGVEKSTSATEDGEIEG